MKYYKVWQTMTRIGLQKVSIYIILLSSIALTGCATLGQKQILLHPVLHEEFFSVPKGTTIGNQTTLQDGYFLSKDYVEQVIKVLKIQD